MPRSSSPQDTIKNPDAFSPTTRYKYSRFSDKNGGFFVKETLLSGMEPLLDREILWHDFMVDFSKKYPHLRVRSPRIEQKSKSKLTLEYIDAPLLANREDNDKLRPKVPRLVELLIAIDEYGAIWRNDRVISETTEGTPYRHIDKRWDVWIQEPLKRGFLTKDMIQQAREVVNEYAESVTPRMQHGDFVPWHIFEKGDEWIIYDGEHSSLSKPRFYDLAYMYTRLFTIGKNKDLAQEILRTFKAGLPLNEREFFEAFIPVVTSRTIGIFMDTLHDRAKINYISETKELYERCMAKSLTALLR